MGFKSTYKGYYGELPAKSRNEEYQIVQECGDIIVDNIPIEIGNRLNFMKSITLMPDIMNVSVMNQGGSIVVKMTFTDGSEEKAVCHGSDIENFTIEQGISICITKKLLDIEVRGKGTSLYNRLVKRGLKVYTNRIKAEAKQAEEERAKEELIQRKRERSRRWVEKCRAKERERQIDIQTEAYYRAMKKIAEEEK